MMADADTEGCHFESRIPTMNLAPFFVLLISAFHFSYSEETPPDQPRRWQVPESIRGESGRAYVVYVEAMPGENWDDKISAAIKQALTGGTAAEVIFPPGHLTITRPIKVWRHRKTAKANTLAEGVELADIRQVWASIKGGRRQDLPKGIVLRGAGGGATRLIWAGGPNQVVIDLPAPWYVEVRNLHIDGNNKEGLIGLRYRPGWEFEANGGKKNTFEGIRLERLDVGIHIGGPFGPDLVGSTFRQISVNACRIGIRLVGANVAEMWFKECFIGSCEEAGFKLVGHRGRVLRNLREKDEPTNEDVVKDADGREVFIEQMPPELVKQKLRESEHPDVPGSKSRSWAGGGAPTCYMSDIVSHMHHPSAWMIDSNWAAVRLEHVRMEGCSGLLRVSGEGMINVRFNDILIDVNAVTTGNAGGHAIEYHKGGPIYFLGGTFEGPIGLGQNTICYSLGARFLNRKRPMSGYIKEGDRLPKGSFFRHTGEMVTVPHRRWKGERVRSGIHEEIGFRQLPGTAGARIHRLSESHGLTAKVPAGQTSVVVPLSQLSAQPDTAYQVFTTPNWRAGALWVSRKENHQVTISFENTPEREGEIDVVIRRKPFEGQRAP